MFKGREPATDLKKAEVVIPTIPPLNLQKSEKLWWSLVACQKLG
jgi:hypothetical protein